MGLIFPLILYFSLTGVIWNSKLVQGWHNFEKIVFSMALSSGLFIVLASWSSLFSQINIRLAVYILTTLGGILTLQSIRTIFRSKVLYLAKLSRIEKFAVLITIIMIFKVITIYAVHPIIDPDIINSYLPYARSIVTTGHAPFKDVYTADPMTIPPIGGPILYASNYILSNSLFTENFRFLTLPAFIGILLLTYLYARKYLSKFNSIVTIIILLSLPGIDGLLFNWSLYPDVIYGFIGLTTFYFLEYIYFNLSSARSQVYLSAALGIILAASILLKSQGLVLVYISLIIIAIKLAWARAWLRFPLGIFIIAPYYLTRHPLTGLTGFGYAVPSLSALVIFSLLSLALALFSISKNQARHYSWTALCCLAPLALSWLGLAWFYRNIALYGSGTTPLTSDYHQFYVIQRLVQTQVEQLSATDFLALLLAPTFGTVYLIPKIIGFFSLITNKLLLIPLFWSLYLYFLTLTFFGGANNRYLLIIFPIIAITITSGIVKFATKPKKILVGVIAFAALSLTQSDFIGWNFGPSFSHLQATLNNANPVVVSTQNSEEVVKNSLQTINYWLRQVAGHTDGQNPYPLMIAVGLGASFLVYTILRIKNIKPTYVSLSIAALVFLLLPYLFIIVRVSHYRPWDFARREQLMLFGNSGEIEFVSPYLKSHARLGSKILIFGPPTSTAYQTALIAWNMYSGYGVKELFPILNSSDAEIMQYFVDNQVDYLVIAQDDLSLTKFDLLDSNTRLVQFIKNPKYFRKDIAVSPGNIWEIYVRESQAN